MQVWEAACVVCFLVSYSTVNWSTGCKYVTQLYLLYIISATVDEVNQSMHDFPSRQPRQVRACTQDKGDLDRFFTRKDETIL